MNPSFGSFGSFGSFDPLPYAPTGDLTFHAKVKSYLGKRGIEPKQAKESKQDPGVRPSTRAHDDLAAALEEIHA